MKNARNLSRLLQYVESRELQVGSGLSLVFGLLFTGVVLRWWVPGLFSEFWLDETGSLWAIQGGFGQITQRIVRFPQSPGYCVLLWLTHLCLGSGPIVFHLLSFIASIITAFALYQLARRFMPVDGAFLALLLWATAGNNIHLSTEARPYAFAMAAAVASALQVERWLSLPTWQNSLLLGVAGILPCYFFFPAITLVGSVIGYAFLRRSLLENVPRARIIAVIVCWIGLGLIPFAHYLAVAPQWTSHALQKVPKDRLSLIWTILPIPFVVSCMIALIVRWMLPGGETRDHDARRHALMLFLAFGTVLPVALFVEAKMGKGLWVGRYLSVTTPFIALLQASVLGGVRPLTARLAALIVLASFCFPGPVREFWNRPVIPDRSGYAFDGAIVEVKKQLAEPGSVLISASGFAEGERWRFPVSDFDKEWLLAPISTLLPQERAVLVPVRLEQGDENYRRSIKEQMKSVKRAVYFGGPVPDWLGNVFRDEGLEKNTRLRGSYWEVLTFTRLGDGERDGAVGR